jgi:hypothetical protein
VSGILIGIDEATTARKGAIKAFKLDKEIVFDTLIARLPVFAGEISSFAKSKRLMSPKSNEALMKLSRGEILLTVPEKNALKYLLERMGQLGFDISQF